MMDRETMDRELSHLRHRVGELEERMNRLGAEYMALLDELGWKPDGPVDLEKWTEAAGKIAKWAGWPDDMELELDDVTNNPMVSIDLWFGDDGHAEVLDKHSNYRPVKPLHDVIRESGWAEDFVYALKRLVWPSGEQVSIDEADFLIATATPAQRTAALLKVIEEE